MIKMFIIAFIVLMAYGLYVSLTSDAHLIHCDECNECGGCKLGIKRGE